MGKRSRCGIRDEHYSEWESQQFRGQIRVVVRVPARQATQAGGPVQQPYSIVDYIPTSGTKNTAIDMFSRQPASNPDYTVQHKCYVDPNENVYFHPVKRENQKIYTLKRRKAWGERWEKYINIYNPQLDSLGGAESNYRLRTKRGKTSPGTRDLGPVVYTERGELSL